MECLVPKYPSPVFLKDFIYLFLEKGKRREKERERNIDVWLPLARPQLGTWPATQACALTGNQTSDLLACSAGTQSTEPHQPGLLLLLKKKKKKKKNYKTEQNIKQLF